MSKHFSFCHLLLISKTICSLAQDIQKIDFWGFPVDGTPKLCQNICLLKIKENKTSLSSRKNWFWGSFNQGFIGVSGTFKLCQNISVLNIK